jgi:acylphosphatase
MKRIKVLVSGKVQGVYYRQSLFEFVANLKITGYVRNLSSGEVQAEIQGTKADLDLVLAWCSHGPPMSEVSGLSQEFVDVLEGESKFEIRR